jgi:hypothetical protein
VKALAREYPPKHHVLDLQGPRSNVAAVVAAQALLVSCGTKCCLAPGLFEQEEAVSDDVLLTKLI